jgi:hypothetical protein
MANLKSIANKIKNSPKTSREIKRIVTQKFEKEKDILLQNFEFHPVTQEMMGGPDADNLSGTLIGYGNLFSFIGFDSSTDPVSPVKKMLRDMIKIKNIRKSSGNKVSFNANVKILDLEDFRSVAPMPWEGGRSWVEGIEKGISGFGYYLHAARSSSRSGKGIQANRIRVMTFKNVKYMSELIRNFTKRVRKLR